MTAQENNKRMAWLDSLRAIAALLVLFQHYFYNRYFIGGKDAIYLQPQYELFRCINFGKVGVVIFFLISGAIIPYSLLNSRHPSPIKFFMFARFFRLYPAYWLSVAIAALSVGALGSKAFFINLTMLQQFVGVKNLNDVYWTLQIELIFYAICGYLFYRNCLAHISTTATAFGLLLCFAFVMAVARAYLQRALPVAVPLGLATMFLGTAFYWLMSDHAEMSLQKFRRLCLIFLLALLPICLLAYSKDTGFSERWYAYYFSYFIAGAIFLLASTRFRINNRVLTYLGLISYSIYLLHPLCRVSIWVDASDLGAALNFFLSISFTLICAALSYCFIERPAQALGKRLSLPLTQRPLNIVNQES